MLHHSLNERGRWDILFYCSAQIPLGVQAPSVIGSAQMLDMP